MPFNLGSMKDHSKDFAAEREALEKAVSSLVDHYDRSIKAAISLERRLTCWPSWGLLLLLEPFLYVSRAFVADHNSEGDSRHRPYYQTETTA